MPQYNVNKYKNSTFDVPKSFCKEQIMEFIKEKMPAISKSPVMLPIDDWCSNPNRQVKTENIVNCMLSPYHNHNFIEINYCADGCISEYIEGKELFLNSGDFLIMSSSVFHVSVPCAGTTAYNVLMRTGFYNETILSMKELNPHDRLCADFGYAVFRGSPSDSVVGQIIAMLTSNEYDNSPYQCIVSENMARLLLCKISEAVMNNRISAQYEQTRGFMISDISALIQYIDENYAHISLKTLSERFGYSSVQIQRIIKKQTGTTFCKYINSLRVSRAAHLLSETSTSISQIASVLGFSSHEYFSRMFKDSSGYSPSDYRRQFCKQ